MKIITKRACKGGEYGANGEWYEGGKFINTIPENNKKHGSTKTKTRKVQIEPYVWVESDKRPLMRFVGTSAAFAKNTDGKLIMQPYTLVFNNGISFFGDSFEYIQNVCNRFNNGERLE